MSAWRGLSTDGFDAGLKGKLKVGATYIDKGYMSATFDQEIAKKYATGIVLQITLPKGKSTGAYIGNLSESNYSKKWAKKLSTREVKAINEYSKNYGDMNNWLRGLDKKTSAKTKNEIKLIDSSFKKFKNPKTTTVMKPGTVLQLSGPYTDFGGYTVTSNELPKINTDKYVYVVNDEGLSQDGTTLNHKDPETKMSKDEPKLALAGLGGVVMPGAVVFADEAVSATSSSAAPIQADTDLTLAGDAIAVQKLKVGKTMAAGTTLVKIYYF
ncbi:hypothetical protein H7R52_18725 [Weissella confusa]|uniref:ADP ribosyltransferase domain-containing protein n=1 Tax=Weissella confusa TaxID=1583 RepID=A0A923NK82_WEICO|nr:hypothetical protein [Weissella confusa]